MTTRKTQIEDHLAAVEGLDDDRFQSWEPQFVKVARRDYDRFGDLKESQFATLEAIRGRVAPRALKRSGADDKGSVTAAPSSMKDGLCELSKQMALQEKGHALIEMHGRQIAISWAKVEHLSPAEATAREQADQTAMKAADAAAKLQTREGRRQQMVGRLAEEVKAGKISYDQASEIMRRWDVANP